MHLAFYLGKKTNKLAGAINNRVRPPFSFLQCAIKEDRGASSTQKEPTVLDIECKQALTAQ